MAIGTLAVVDEGERNCLIDVEQRADGDLIPGGVLDGVVVNDEVAGVYAGARGGGIDGDVVGLGRAADVLLYLVVEHGDAGDEAESQG